MSVLLEGAYSDVLLIEGNPLKNLDLLADQNNFKIIMKDDKIYKNTIQ